MTRRHPGWLLRPTRDGTLKSINQSTVLSALELAGNDIDDRHGKAAEALNKLLISVAQNTLGEVPPHISRLYPTLEALAKAGTIEVEHQGRRYFRIKLTQRDFADPTVLADLRTPTEADQTIITALGVVGGVNDDTGRASILLRELVDEGVNPGTWRTRIEDCERRGWIRRVMGTSGQNARKTIRIELSDAGEAWYKAYAPIATPIELPGEDVTAEYQDEVFLDVEPEPLIPVRDNDDEEWVDNLAHKLLSIVVERAKEPWIDPKNHEKLIATLAARDGTIEGFRAQVAQMASSADKLRADRKEADDLFRVADDENKKLRRQVVEQEQTIDKIAKERDEFRRKFTEIEAHMDQVLGVSERRQIKKVAKDIRDIVTD